MIQRLVFVVAAGMIVALPALPQGFKTLRTVHVVVAYQPGVTQEQAQRVADYIEEDYSYLSDKLGIDLRRPLEVRIYDSVGKFLTETKLKKPWRGALFHRGILHLQPVDALITRDIFNQSLSYEFALAMLDSAGTKGCPRWLREALAVYHCGELPDLTPPIGVRLSSFSDLDQDIQTYPNPPQRNDVHFILGHTMLFFVERYGEDKAMSLFRSFDGFSSLEKVVKGVLGDDLSAVEKSWSAYIAQVTSPFKKK